MLTISVVRGRGVPDDSQPVAAGNPRLRSFAIVVAAFFVFNALFFGLKSVITHAITIPAPSRAPAVWWNVFVTLSEGGAVELFAALVPLCLYLRFRHRQLADLGFARPGTLIAWVLALAVEAGIIWLQVHSPYGPIARAPNPTNLYALAAGLIIGLCASIAEETVFRGYVMDELKRGGFSIPLQILISMVLFGALHVSYTSLDWTVPVLTGLLGGFWSIVYVLGKRSLWPTIAAHIANDAVTIPSTFYMIVQFAAH